MDNPKIYRDTAIKALALSNGRFEVSKSKLSKGRERAVTSFGLQCSQRIFGADKHVMGDDGQAKQTMLASSVVCQAKFFEETIERKSKYYLFSHNY